MDEGVLAYEQTPGPSIDPATKHLDGDSEMTSKDLGFADQAPPLRFVRFDLEHDCPLARMSLEFPKHSFTVWSGHGTEILRVECTVKEWQSIVETARRFLRIERAFPAGDGGILVASLQVADELSISRTLERHHCMWLQPMSLRGGREQYEAIAYGHGEAAEQEAMTALSAHGRLVVNQRRSITKEELLESLFFPLRSVLHAPTDAQLQALLQAESQGYYESPRRATTAAVARSMGLGRSSFEERLRGGENRVFEILLPLMRQQRYSHPGTGRDLQ